jgi:hypothetical protein
MRALFEEKSEILLKPIDARYTGLRAIRCILGYSEYSIIASPPDHRFCCNYRIVAIIDKCNFLKNSYKLQLKKKKFKTRVLRYCLIITEIL